MITHHFIAYSAAKEFDRLNQLAEKIGMNRKYRWEEPMILTPKDLPKVFTTQEEAEKFIYLFSFGSIVFINCGEDEIKAMMDFLKKEIDEIDSYQNVKHIDEYDLEIDPKREQKITNDYAIIPEFRPNVLDMISTVIAKSVALERIESVLEKIFDDVDLIINRLEQGKLEFKEKAIAKLVARVLHVSLGSLSYIMVLDKPDITWNNILADQFYIEMAELFELIDRYEDSKHKSEVIKDSIDSFMDLAHAKRATRLELWIIYLILFEIIFALVEKGHGVIEKIFTSLF